jgi:putative membrane protein
MRDVITRDPTETGNYFAWIRTLLAAERTLKAETRTSLSLIAFGFTIVQFFNRLRDMNTSGHPIRVGTPRDLGLTLIAIGVGSAIISIWQYRQLVDRLWNMGISAFISIEEKPTWTPTVLVLAIVCLIGIFAFVAILVHLT